MSASHELLHQAMVANYEDWETSYIMPDWVFVGDEKEIYLWKMLGAFRYSL